MKVWLSVYRFRTLVGLVEVNSLEQAEKLVARLALAQRASRLVARDESGQEYTLTRDGKFVPGGPSGSVFELPFSGPIHPARR